MFQMEIKAKERCIRQKDIPEILINSIGNGIPFLV